MAQAQLDHVLRTLQAGSNRTYAVVAAEFHVPVAQIMRLPPQATEVTEQEDPLYDGVVFRPDVPALLTKDNPVVRTAKYAYVYVHDGHLDYYFKFNLNN